MTTRTKRPFRILAAALIIAAIPLALPAEVKLPAVIGDHMVLQQDKPIAIWGWAGPNEQVTVRLADKELRARASADGKWRVVFDPLKAGKFRKLDE